jgi:hypothetical protein
LIDCPLARTGVGTIGTIDAGLPLTAVSKSASMIAGYDIYGNDAPQGLDFVARSRHKCLLSLAEFA